MIAPLVEKLDEQYKNIKFAEVDVDQSQPIARKYEVSSMYVETHLLFLCFVVFLTLLGLHLFTFITRPRSTGLSVQTRRR